MFKPVMTAAMVRRAQAEMAHRPPLSRMGLADSWKPFFGMTQRVEVPKTTEEIQDFVFEQLLIDTRQAARTEVYMAEQALKVFGSFGELR